MADAWADRTTTRSRSWGLIAAAILLALVFLAIGIVVGRAGNEAQTTVTESSGDPQTVVAKSGPTRAENGVPVGYPQSEAGVIQAAINYERTFAKPMGDDTDAFRTAIETITTENYRATALREYVAEDDPGANGYPLAYKLSSFNDDAATVKLWSVGLIPSEQGNPQQIWLLGTMELVWEDGDWKVDGLSSELGPTPPSITESDGPTSFDIVEDYTRIDYEPASQP